MVNAVGADDGADDDDWKESAVDRLSRAQMP